MVGNDSLDGRTMTKRVIADFCEGWRAVWLVVHLAVLHPNVASSVVALLDLVIDEARAEAGEVVSPPRDDAHGTEQQFDGDGDRDVKQDVGGGQQQDRAVEERVAAIEQNHEALARWHADLEDEVVRLRDAITAISAAAAQAVRPTNTE